MRSAWSTQPRWREWFHLDSGGQKTIKAVAAMKKRKSHRQKESRNASGQNGSVRKQHNKKPAQPLSKVQCEKSQLVLEAVVTTKHCNLIDSPEKRSTIDCEQLNHHVVISTDSFVYPFPLLPRWRDTSDVWLQAYGYSSNYRNSANFMKKHPCLEPRMRSILLDWLIEVCEAYTLHRQTFYLALDYFDRFMMTQSNVQKGMLQLIGITCLFIASKMEESRPPKLWQMVYVTADTYNEKDIVQMELIILKTLNWKLRPETAVSWMNLFFQLASRDPKSDLLERQFPVDIYLLMTRLLDLCIISINALDFYYEVLAASVLCYFIPQETVEMVTDLPKNTIQPCISWMAPFAQSSSRFGSAMLKHFAEKMLDRHTIQTHSDYLTMLDDAAQTMALGQFPTPPSSTEKICTL